MIPLRTTSVRSRNRGLDNAHGFHDQAIVFSHESSNYLPPGPGKAGRLIEDGLCFVMNGFRRNDPVAGVFGTTSWTVVYSASSGAEPESIEAWDALARQYWRPLYCFCRRRGDPPELAEDRVQGFFQSLLERDRLGTLDPGRGQFRDWLMAAMDRYRQGEWRAASVQKRNPRGGFDPRDISEVEVALEASAGFPIGKAFEREWATTVLELARIRLRDHFVSRGMGPKFNLFWPRLHPGVNTAGQTELAVALSMTPESVATALWQFRKEYRRQLIGVVRETMEEGADVEGEIRALMQAFS